jgi:hypothetical protein
MVIFIQSSYFTINLGSIEETVGLDDEVVWGYWV